MPAPPAEDFRGSAAARRQSWYGAKRWVKALVAVPGVNPAVRRVLAVARPGTHLERLPVPLHVRRVEGTVGPARFVMLDPGRCVVAKELYWGNGRRPGAADQLALEAFAALSAGAQAVLDVGAYTGIFSLVGARCAPQAQVHAFEVVPGNAAAALANVVANDLLTSITVHVAAVGGDGGRVLVPTGEGGSALPDFWSSQSGFTSGVSVPVRSLDRLLDGWHGPPVSRAVVKVDVEGAEDDVLLNARRLLAAWRPDVLCELLPERAKVTAVVESLHGLGYRYLLVEDDAVVEHEEPFGHPRYRDWLFTARSDAELTEAGVPVRGVASARP